MADPPLPPHPGETVEEYLNWQALDCVRSPIQCGRYGRDDALATGFGDEVIGVDLMNKAFGPTGPLTDVSAGKGEQYGTRMLFAGAYAVLRNPAGHRQVDYADLSEAAEAVQTASLLMRILDRVEDRLLAAGRNDSGLSS